MKKLLMLMVALGLGAGIITSCGSGEKKQEEATEEEKEEAYDDYETAEAPRPSGDDLIAQGKTLADASDCKTCHHLTNKIVGPSHTDVAKKYEFTQGNVVLLAGKIIKGGSGVWGEIPMTAHPDITQADAEKMAMYVLSLDGEKQKD